MEYAVRAETKEGDVVTFKRGFRRGQTLRIIPFDCLSGSASGLNE